MPSASEEKMDKPKMAIKQSIISVHEYCDTEVFSRETNSYIHKVESNAGLKKRSFSNKLGRLDQADSYLPTDKSCCDMCPTM